MTIFSQLSRSLFLLKGFFLLALSIPTFLSAQIPQDTAIIGKNLDSLYQKARMLYFTGGNEEKFEAINICVLETSKYAAYFPLINANAFDLRAAYYLGLANRHEEAKADFLNARGIRLATVGENHPDFARSENNLAAWNRMKGNYQTSDSLFENAARVWANTIGTKNVLYANAIHGRATILHLLCEYAKAEPLYQEAKNIRFSLEGYRDRASSLNDMGIFYKETGRWERADSFFFAAGELYLQINGNKSNAEYAGIVNNRATLQAQRGHFRKAIELFKEAGLIIAATEGIESDNYATFLSNIANVFQQTGHLDSAQYYLGEAISLKKNRSRQSKALVLVNLSKVYLKNNSLDNGKAALEEALELLKDDPVSPTFRAAVHNLAFVYEKMGLYNLADSLYLMALRLHEDNWNNDLSEFTQLALLYGHFNRTIKRDSLTADIYYLKANTALTEHMISTSLYLTEEEMVNYVNLHQPEWDFFVDLLAQNPSDSQYATVAYNNALFFRGAALRNLLYLAAVRSQGDQYIKLIFDTWQQKRRALGEKFVKLNEFSLLKETKDEAANLEKQLMRVPAIANLQKLIRWNDVRDRLQLGEAAIEFIAYRPYNTLLQNSDTIVKYAAFVLRPNDPAPIFVSLCDGQLLNRLVESYRLEKEHDIKAFYNKTELYHLIWKPLEIFLNEVKVIYYVPDGILHKISFDAIKTGPDGKVLADEYEKMIRLGSTRQLVIPNIPVTVVEQSKMKAAIYGGINYEPNCMALASDLERWSGNHTESRGEFLSASPSVDNRIRASNEKFIPLAFTALEADSIGEMLHKHGFTGPVLKGYSANEPYFKQMPGPEVVHIGTHGFFFDKDENSLSIFQTHENPLIRSGLALAGANLMWLNKSTCANNNEDGILTAYEVSQLNLLGTELVVLSACETGLGELVGGEGVYGLQRAFKIAGAKYIIMSLWQVPDHLATCSLFNRFYENWLGKKLNIREAFQAAQAEVRETWPNAYFWAGFVLVE